MLKKLKKFIARKLRACAQSLDYVAQPREVPEFYRLPESATLARKVVGAEIVFHRQKWLTMGDHWGTAKREQHVNNQLFEEMGAEIIRKIRDAGMVQISEGGNSEEVLIRAETYIYLKNG